MNILFYAIILKKIKVWVNNLTLVNMNNNFGGLYGKRM